MNTQTIEQEIQRLFVEARQEIQQTRRLIESLNKEKDKKKLTIKGFFAES